MSGGVGTIPYSTTLFVFGSRGMILYFFFALFQVPSRQTTKRLTIGPLLLRSPY